MLILTIVMMNSGGVLDIMVKPEQRIKDILQVLSENGQITYGTGSENLYIRSWRMGNLVNLYLTFKQAEIFSGDILYIEAEEL